VRQLRETVMEQIRNGGKATRDTGQRPTYAPGDRVVAVARPVPGHTRCPRYVWDKTGVVVSYWGNHVFPDTSAHQLGENPQPLYAVRFDGRDLWGADAEPGTSFTVDLWESYLRSADR
jgi:nitrile hydratase subunit beta